MEVLEAKFITNIKPITCKGSERLFITSKARFTVASINGGLIYFAKFPGVSESLNLCVATILRVTQYVDLAARTQLVCQGLIFGNGRPDCLARKKVHNSSIVVSVVRKEC